MPFRGASPWTAQKGVKSKSQKSGQLDEPKKQQQKKQRGTCCNILQSRDVFGKKEYPQRTHTDY